MNCFKSGAVIMLVLGAAACADNGSTIVKGTLDGIVTTDEYYSAHQSPTDPDYGMQGFKSVDEYYGGSAAPSADPARKVSDEDCAKPVNPDGSNLRCK
ncbi:MAG TPA: hypothetical protein VKS43_14380 [Burkholderiales bacterium]|nr:hypothetical protein [Burkholderiales bacterium]